MQTILCHLLLFCASLYEARRGYLRVYQGKEDVHDEFPFVVALYYGTDRGCSGSLISKTWVITAGHCIHLASPGVITIRYKVAISKNKPKIVETVETYLHPNYSRHQRLKTETISNDIGLIRTKEVATETFASLSAVHFKGCLGLHVKYTGFGNTGKKLSKEVMKWPLQISEGVVTKCPSKKGGFHPAMCVAPKHNSKIQIIGQGDSGGPLMRKGKIVAVASGRETHWGAISIFTPVSPSLNWIRHVVF